MTTTSAVTELTIADAAAILGLWADAPLNIVDAPAMASPSWWGADSRTATVLADVPDEKAGTSAFVKVPLPHAAAYSDLASAVAAATEAGAIGIAPRVLAADPATGSLATEELTESTKTATMDDFLADAALESLLTARRAVAELGFTRRTDTVFDDIRRISALAENAGAVLPPDLPWMLRRLAPAEQRIVAAGWDPTPIHGDANLSNVLLRPNGEVLLVDWDHVTCADPLQDLGAALFELRPIDSGAKAAFEIATGSFDQSLFDRSRIYGIANAVRGGLIGSYVDAVRPGTLEYSKFSDWQFLRARWGLSGPQFDDRVRSV